jgi:hypothetical protein
MLRTRGAVTAIVLMLALVLPGCSGGGSTGSGSGTPGSQAGSIPSGLKADVSKAAALDVSANGTGAAVRSGDATMAVYVPAGAAQAGAKWRLVPLTSAPAGAKKPLCPGVWVDTAGAEPTKPCLIGFALPGKAATNATIVRLGDDGSAAQIIPTTRVELGGMTLLSATVDGFSPYTTSEEDQAAIDKAAVDRAKARGQSVDWTIKAGGAETQHAQGWTFDYELDFFASGGGEGQGGIYNGHAMLSLQGKYKGPVSIVKSFGNLSGTGRDQKLRFIIVDAQLASLLTGEPVGDPIIAGSGAMQLEGLGSLDISAVGPTVSGRYNKKNQSAKGAVPFTIKVSGNDVQVEIAKVGIFPGKILRTTK